MILNHNLEKLSRGEAPTKSIKNQNKKNMEKLDFDEWCFQNENELYCEAAETGADREPEYCPQDFCEKKYEMYLEKNIPF